MRLLPLIILFTSSLLGLAEEDFPVLSLQRKEWEEARSAAQAKVDKSYFLRLQELKKDLVKKGDLDAARAFDKAVKGEAKGDEDEPATLTKIRTARDKALEAAFKPIDKNYWEDLKLLKGYTQRQGDLEKMEVVIAEIDKVLAPYKQGSAENEVSNPQIPPTPSEKSQGQATNNSTPDSPGFLKVIGGTLPPESWAGAQRVNSFYIGKTEVTWANWKEIRSWAALNDYDIEEVGNGIGDRYPVTNVTWHQVLKWCNAASEKEGLRPVYRAGTLVYRTGDNIPSVDKSANGYRLPTEKEWEFAARGGISKNNFQYSGSNDANEVAWYLDNSEGTVHEVASKKPNELGLSDMSGNVWEWCFDVYSVSPAYNRTPLHTQVGVLQPGDRVGRGGHRGNYVNYCSVANSYYSTPTETDNFRGFRVAHNSPSPK